MVTFSFREFGENLGTRQLGQQVRERLMPLLEGDERVVLDFTGVDVVSNSFADECFASQVLNLFDTLNLRQNKIGIGTYAHRTPRLVVVVVLPQHQFQGFLRKAVVVHHCLLGRHVNLVNISFVELYQSHDTVVDQCNELRADAFSNQRLLLDFQ